MSLPYSFNADDVIAKGRTTRSDVEIIKTWLKDMNKNIVPTILPDELIVEFLLSCENDIEFTKTTIIAHYKLKNDGPELHDNRDAECEEMKTIFDIWTIATLPTRTKENYAIHYFRLESSDLQKFDVLWILKATLMLIDVTLEKDPPDGFITIIDMGPVGFMHLTKLKLDPIKKYFSFIQEGLTMQLKAIHIMNSNMVMNKVFNFVKKFIKTDVLNVIHFHQSNMKLETFYEYIPQKCLPKEYDGDLPPLEVLSEITKEQFKNRQIFWNEEEQLRKHYQ